MAIVPVKPLRRGKSRLITVLNENQRTRANEIMLCHVLSELTKVAAITEILVISTDPRALSIAREFSCRTIRENRITNINQALRKANKVAKSLGANVILILPADLPIVKADDISKIITQCDREQSIVICPDRHQQGTNALLLNPSNALQFDFGIDSFRKHLEQAERKKVKTQVLMLDSISFDLDNPADLEYLNHLDASIYNKICFS